MKHLLSAAFAALCLAAVVPLVGCGDDGKGGTTAPDPNPGVNPDPNPEVNPDPNPEVNPDPNPDPVVTSCVRTAALDEARVCRSDDDCPCGAHCDLGVCDFDCREDADCGAGEVCTDFGRCDGADAGRIRALAGVRASARFQVRPNILRVAARDALYTVQIRPATPDSSGRVRVSAVGSARLQCEPDAELSDECLFDSIPPEGRPLAMAMPPNVEDIEGAHGADVHDDQGNFEPVRIILSEEAPEAPLAGRYAGTLSVNDGAGMVGAPDIEGALPITSLKVPIEARLFVDEEGIGVIEITDTTGSALPVSTVVVELALSDDALTIIWPIQVWAGAAFGDGVEVAALGVASPVTFEGGGFKSSILLSFLNFYSFDFELGRNDMNLVLDMARTGPLDDEEPPPLTESDELRLPITSFFFPLDVRGVLDGVFSGAGAGAAILSGDDRSVATCIADLSEARGTSLEPICLDLTPAQVRNPVCAPNGDDAFAFACSYTVREPGLDPTCPARRTQCINACPGLEANRQACTDAVGNRTCGSCEDIEGGRFYSHCDGFDGECTDCTDLSDDQGCDSVCNDFRTSERARCEGACPICDDPGPQETTVNRCEEAVALTGCTVRNVNRNFVPGVGLEVSTKVLQVCELDAVPVPDLGRCAQAALCASPDQPNAPAGFDITEFSRRSGDPLCENTGLAIPLAGALEQEPSDLELLQQQCVADLQRLAEGDINADNFFDTEGCLSPGRLMAAIELGGQHILSTRGEPDQVVGGAVVHRAVQAMVEIQTLNTRIALALHRESVTRGDLPPNEETFEALEASQGAWGVLLDRRVAYRLAQTHPAVLTDPNARQWLGLDAQPDAPLNPSQGVGVMVLEALTAELELLDYMLERAWFESNGDAIEDRRARVRQSIKTGQLLIELSEALRATTAGEPTWEEAWQNAKLGYVAMHRRIHDRLDAIDQGLNPLGIEDTDIPIVFPGDPTGDRERFTAISRFLLGDGPGGLSLVPRAITTASDALDEAIDELRVRTDLEIESERRIDDLTARYGELITGYCGGPIDDPDFDIGSLNVLDRPIDVETCFIEPACREREEAFLEELSAAELGFQICLATRFRTRFGFATGPLPSRIDPGVFDALTDKFSVRAIGGNAFPLVIEALTADVNDRTARISVDGETYDLSLSALGQLGAEISPELLVPVGPGGGSRFQTPLAAVIDVCEAARQSTERQRPTVAGNCDLADDCPINHFCRLGTCEADDGEDPLDNVDCYYDGEMSEQAIAVRGAAIEVEIARLELEDHIDTYDIARKSCIIAANAGNVLEEKLSAHNETMADLNKSRTIAASVGIAMAGGKDCASGDFTGNAISAGIACGFAAAEAASNIAVETLDNQILAAERKHEAAVLALENETAEKICYNDAEMELVGIKAAALRIKRAKQDQAVNIINLRGLKSYTAGLWEEGNFLINKERRRAERALPSRFALSRKAELYLDRFRYAQRLTFLAVRAVEYEFQAPLAQLRRGALAATRPEQLEEILQTLSGEVNNGQINGSAPVGLLAVVSLRQHLLQLRDRSDAPDGEQTLTDIERFRLLLVDPAYAVYDGGGRYLGQQYPFSLQPLGAFELGQSQGVPIVAQNDCAERVWSVNAAVITEDPVGDDDASFTRMDLLQRNTFFSQRCREPNEGDDPFQISSVRPSINLLSDFFTFDDRNPDAGADNVFTRGQMQPYLNVSRQEFEQEIYEQGSTTQLAGRGLYSDYALFIPAAALSIDNSAGLRLNNVDDILLRVDYVAAARQ